VPVEAIIEQLRAQSPPDRLRLAAALLEAQRDHLAHRIASDVVLELGAVLALARPGRGPGG
jgi:hypothetical protein